MSLWSRITNVFRADRLDSEIDEESNRISTRPSNRVGIPKKRAAPSAQSSVHASIAATSNLPCGWTHCGRTQSSA